MGHDFNGHVINGIHGVNGKKCYDRAFHLVNNCMTLLEFMTLAEIFATTIFSVKLMHDCIEKTC